MLDVILYQPEIPPNTGRWSCMKRSVSWGSARASKMMKINTSEGS